MSKADVLALLREGAYISGEEISRTLGISRTAVCKTVGALREAGFQIDAAPKRGYRLLCRPLQEAAIRTQMPDCPWRLTVLEETDSTNNVLKRDCAAPHGAVAVACRQTGGRGRLGRSFSSPPGGVYLSVLLRPSALPEELLHLTPMTAVATRRAIADCCGVEAGIKWTNDLVADGKKLCGILTELTTEAGSGALQSVIIGIGINCNTEEFPAELRDKAISLRQITGHPLDPNRLAAALVRRLYEMDACLFREREAWMREYAAACITVGKAVQVVRGAARRSAFAEGIDENGGLRVRWENGETEIISAGEVSVRGMYGYS